MTNNQVQLTLTEGIDEAKAVGSVHLRIESTT